jgi:phosphoserine aminotransferase
MPKLFRMTKGGKLNGEIFEGSTINTPSMLCVEDYLDALKWAASIGGLAELQRRADNNLAVLEAWAQKTGWVGFLAEDPAIRSNTSVCLKVIDARVTSLPDEAQADFAKKLASALEKEDVALDVGGYRDAPPGLRIWCGATVEKSDLEALLPWLDWAFGEIEREFGAKAA